MTPREKAIEIVDRFQIELKEHKGYYDYETSRQCALICVDEMIKHLPNINNTPPIKRNEEYFYFQFWVGVKEEINKL